MSLIKNEEHVLKYTYDFSRDGGATSDIDLTADGGGSLDAGMVVRGISVVADTTLTSGGSPTLTFGNEDDRDGYLIDVFSEVTTAGDTVREGEVAGALLWDDTNDHAIEYTVPDTGAAVPSLTIGTAALTAGKLVVYLRVYNPGAA